MDEIKAILNKLPRQLCVRFALYCCNDIKDLIKDTASIKAIALTQLWLDTDGAGVTTEELRAAASATSATSATSAAYATANAASAAWAAAAASAAAANAAAAASAAADADVAYTANRNEKMSQYKTYLLKMIAELTELERLIYDLNGGEK